MDINEIKASLRAEIQRLTAALNALEGSPVVPVTPESAWDKVAAQHAARQPTFTTNYARSDVQGVIRRRHWSREGKQRISLAAQLRGLKNKSLSPEQKERKKAIETELAALAPGVQARLIDRRNERARAKRAAQYGEGA